MTPSAMTNDKDACEHRRHGAADMRIVWCDQCDAPLTDEHDTRVANRIHTAGLVRELRTRDGWNHLVTAAPPFAGWHDSEREMGCRQGCQAATERDGIWYRCLRPYAHEGPHDNGHVEWPSIRDHLPDSIPCWCGFGGREPLPSWVREGVLFVAHDGLWQVINDRGSTNRDTPMNAHFCTIAVACQIGGATASMMTFAADELRHHAKPVQGRTREDIDRYLEQERDWGPRHEDAAPCGTHDGPLVAAAARIQDRMVEGLIEDHNGRPRQPDAARRPEGDEAMDEYERKMSKHAESLETVATMAKLQQPMAAREERQACALESIAATLLGIHAELRRIREGAEAISDPMVATVVEGGRGPTPG